PTQKVILLQGHVTKALLPKFRLRLPVDLTCPRWWSIFGLEVIDGVAKEFSTIIFRDMLKLKIDFVDSPLHCCHDRASAFHAEKYVVRSSVKRLAPKPPLYSQILPACFILEISDFPQCAIAEVGHEFVELIAINTFPH